MLCVCVCARARVCPLVCAHLCVHGVVMMQKRGMEGEEGLTLCGLGNLKQHKAKGLREEWYTVHNLPPSILGLLAGERFFLFLCRDDDEGSVVWRLRIVIDVVYYLALGAYNTCAVQCSSPENHAQATKMLIKYS